MSLVTILTTIQDIQGCKGQRTFKTHCPVPLRSVISLRCLASGTACHPQGSASHTHPLTTLRRILSLLWISKEAMLLLCKLTKTGDETASDRGPSHDTAQVLVSLLTGLMGSSKCTATLGPTLCVCAHAEVGYKAQQWNWVPMQILTNHVRNSSRSLPSCFL